MNFNPMHRNLPATMELASPMYIHHPVLMGFLGLVVCIAIGCVLWRQMQSIPPDD